MIFEVESRSRLNGGDAYNRMNLFGEKEYYDVMLARHAERGLDIHNHMQGGSNDILNYER